MKHCDKYLASIHTHRYTGKYPNTMLNILASMIFSKEVQRLYIGEILIEDFRNVLLYVANAFPSTWCKWNHTESHRGIQISLFPQLLVLKNVTSAITKWGLLKLVKLLKLQCSVKKDCVSQYTAKLEPFKTPLASIFQYVLASLKKFHR